MEYRIQVVRNLIDETDISWNMFLNYLRESDYFRLYNIMEEKERRFYNNKLCSDLAVICEKYSKALYLKTATIPDDIINRLNLNDDDIVNLIIGSDDQRTNSLYNQLTKEEKKQIFELKFHGIGHNFTKLFDDNNKFLRDIQYYFNKGMNQLKNITDDELKELLYSDKIYDAFVKGRYSSLNDYYPDFGALITLCETLQRKIKDGNSFFDIGCVSIFASDDGNLLTGFYNYKKSIESHTEIYGGYQPGFGIIKHIYPTFDSKIIVNSNKKSSNYYYGEHLSFSYLYKPKADSNSLDFEKKSVEEILKGINHADKNIGLYTLDNTNNSLEYRVPITSLGFIIEDGDSIIYDDNNGKHIIISIGGQLIQTNYDLVKDALNKGDSLK